MTYFRPTEARFFVSSGLIKFDEFALDRDRYELLRASRPVKLEKAPMELLILLLEKDGHLVTRQQIIERLWGNDVFVDTEHWINTAIRKIRQALKDDSDQPRFVQTVTGKGYRFVAAVANVENGRSSRLPASQRMWDRKPEHSVRIAWMAARFQSHRCSAPLVAFRQRRCAILFSGLLSSSFWHY